VELILFLLTIYDRVRLESNCHIAAWRTQLCVGSGKQHQIYQGLFIVPLAALWCCTVAKLLGPGGVKAIVADSIPCYKPVKQLIFHHELSF
jgi:hypothetical protein